MAVLTNLAQKGLVPLIRGTFVKIWLAEARGSFFLGKGCKILNKSMLKIGNNVYIGNYGYLDCLSVDGVTIGNSVTIREGCWVQLTSHYDKPGEGITIGNNVYIGPRSILGAAAQITIGDRCQLGANVSLIAENHAFSGEGDIFEQGVVRKGICIERDVWIGNNVTVLDGVTVGEGSVLGAGTVLTRSVPARSVVVGVPGRVIKTR
ncbi:acyltransferase [Granulicella pectinivorans]|nr:acyltransferase [Granulicella pectinivorans]